MLATNNSNNVVLKLAMDAPENINENESLPDPIDLFTETSAGSKKLFVLRLTSQNEEEKLHDIPLAMGTEGNHSNYNMHSMKRKKSYAQPQWGGVGQGT